MFLIGKNSLGILDTDVSLSIKLLPILFLLPGCSFIPFFSSIPLPVIYVNNSKTLFDTISMFRNSPTSNDILISKITGMNCRMSNMIKDKDICIEKSATEKIQEYVITYRMELNK